MYAMTTVSPNICRLGVDGKNMYMHNGSVGIALSQCYTQQDCTGIDAASAAVDAGNASASGSRSNSGSNDDDFDVPTGSTSRIGLDAG